MLCSKQSISVVEEGVWGGGGVGSLQDGTHSKRPLTSMTHENIDIARLIFNNIHIIVHVLQ